MNNTIKKILCTCTIALVNFLIVIGVVAGALGLYNTVLKNDGDVQTNVFKYKPVIVVSGSMLPSIQINSINIVKVCSANEVSIDDVIMYKATNGMMIVHRVMEIHETNGGYSFITKGDNNDEADPWEVEEEQVRGKIVYTCNAVAPLLTDILPVNGEVNAVAMLRAIAMIVIIVSVISVLIQYTTSAIKSIYWVTIGNDKFRRAIEKYTKDIDKASKLQLGEVLCNVPESAPIHTRILIGLRRLYVYHSMKWVSKSVDVISKYSTEKKDKL